MPSTTCTKCSRVNPADAAYCYHDGAVLAGHSRNGGPVAVGAAALRPPLRLPVRPPVPHLRRAGAGLPAGLAGGPRPAAAGLLRELPRRPRPRRPGPGGPRGRPLSRPRPRPRPAARQAPQPTSSRRRVSSSRRRKSASAPSRSARTAAASCTSKTAACACSTARSPATTATGSPSAIRPAPGEDLPVRRRDAHPLPRQGQAPARGQQAAGGPADRRIQRRRRRPCSSAPRCRRQAVPRRRPQGGGHAAPGRREGQGGAQGGGAPSSRTGAVADWYKSNGWTYPVQGPSASGLGRGAAVLRGARPDAAAQGGDQRAGREAGGDRRRHHPPRPGDQVGGEAAGLRPRHQQRPLARGRPGQAQRPRRHIPARRARRPRPGRRDAPAKVTVQANGNQRFPVTVSLAVERAGLAPPAAGPRSAAGRGSAAVPVATAVAELPGRHPRPARRRRRGGRDRDDDDRPRPAGGGDPGRGGRAAGVGRPRAGRHCCGAVSVLVVDFFQPPPESRRRPSVPVVDDSIDPHPLIEVRLPRPGRAGDACAGRQRQAGRRRRADWPGRSRRTGRRVITPVLTIANVGNPNPSTGLPMKHLNFMENGTTNDTVVWLDGEGPPIVGGEKGWIFGESPLARRDKPARDVPDWHGRWKSDATRRLAAQGTEEGRGAQVGLVLRPREGDGHAVRPGRPRRAVGQARHLPGPLSSRTTTRKPHASASVHARHLHRRQRRGAVHHPRREGAVRHDETQDGGRRTDFIQGMEHDAWPTRGRLPRSAAARRPSRRAGPRDAGGLAQPGAGPARPAMQAGEDAVGRAGCFPSDRRPERLVRDDVLGREGSAPGEARGRFRLRAGQRGRDKARRAGSACRWAAASCPAASSRSRRAGGQPEEGSR